MATTAQTTRPATRKAKNRTLALLSWLPDVQGGLLRITESGKPAIYFFQRLSSDFGQAWSVSKWIPADPALGSRGAIGATYHVGLDGDKNECECLGHLKHGHRTVCRHVAAIAALLASGKIA